MLLILSILLVTIFSGCTNTSSGQEQKAVLNIYLEGLRDCDYEKLKQTANIKDLASWPASPDGIKEYLSKVQQETTGKLHSWEFEDKPFIDDNNGQSIVRTELKTEYYNLVMDFDLRKQPDEWRIFGVKTIKKEPVL